VSGGQFDWGGRLLKSNGGAQRFPQAEWKSVVECKGIRELDCETYKSSRTKVGLSDPVVPSGRAIAQRIKATPGITGYLPQEFTSTGRFGTSMSARRILGLESGPKGWAVRPLKRYASWVQNVVRQFGPYPLWA
jgi:hypothetical protein